MALSFFVNKLYLISIFVFLCSIIIISLLYLNIGANHYE